jgi:hypothetical protein
LRACIAAGDTGVSFVHTRMGARIHPDDIIRLTTFLAATMKGRATMRWAPYSADFDALWNKATGAWELVDGEPVTRKRLDSDVLHVDDEESHEDD